MQLYKINRSSTGTPYVMMSTGGKLLVHKPLQKQKTSEIREIEESRYGSNSRDSMNSLTQKLGELSFKRVGKGSSLQRKKYISLA